MLRWETCGSGDTFDSLESNKLKKSSNQSNHLKKKFLFSNSHIILPNASKYMNKLDKKIPQNKKEQVFWERSIWLQGWKWIAFDFWTGCPEIKAVILVKFWTFYSSFFFLLSLYSLLSPLLAFFSFYCKKIKCNHSKLQAKLVKYDIHQA